LRLPISRRCSAGTSALAQKELASLPIQKRDARPKQRGRCTREIDGSAVPTFAVVFRLDA
jgi:hypothetical protein